MIARIDRSSSDWTRTPARPIASASIILLTAALALATAPSLITARHPEPFPARRIDVNTAPAAELELLPSIGPALADRIVTHRTEHGPFDSLKALDSVPGIGPRTLEDLAPFVRFSEPSIAQRR
jgi:competence ComEA-like helix-hairpin-helix protein